MKLSRDLSNYHELVSDMFSIPKNKEEWEQYKLTDDQIQFFHKNGYVSNIKLLEQNHIEQINKELEEIIDPKHPKYDLFYEFHSNESTDPGKIVFHSLGTGELLPVSRCALNPAFTMVASQLLANRPVRFWHDQLFYKPAKKGGVVAWHQDYSYWTRSIPMQHLTVWVGLDDSLLENGCLHYITGSHRWGLLDKPVLTGEMEGIKAFLNEDQIKELENPTPIEMKKGYATIHHPLLVHGSFENSSDRPRRAFVLNVFADGTVSDTDEELLKGVPIIKKGGKLEGQFFPLLFE